MKKTTIAAAMPTPALHLPSRRRVAWLAVAVGCALAGAAHAHDANDDDVPVATTQAVAPPPWWTALHESTLDRLLAQQALAAPADRAQQLATQARATSLYVQARVHSVRLATARAMRETAARQEAVLQQQGRADSDRARGVALLLQASSARERQFEALRSESIAALAQLLGGGHSAGTLAQLLAPALAQSWLPVAEFGIPDAVSGLVLRQRPDVLAAEGELAFTGRGGGLEQLRLAEYLQAISSEIHADQIPDPGASRADPFAGVLRQARAEIARNLAQLTARAESANAQAVHVRELEAASRQALQAFATGRMEEVDVLSAMLLQLVEEDRLAVDLGLAALAWVAFEQSTGGAGQARTSDLLGAGTADD